MFTLFVIILVICILASCKPDTKKPKQRNDDISKLPSIYLKSKVDENPKTNKFMYGYSSLIDTFLYENKRISIVMKDGTSMNAPLDNITVYFGKDQAFKWVHIGVEFKGQKLQIINEPVLLSREECDVINNVLTLAGKTYGASMFSSFNKGVGTVNSILKILKALQ